MKIAILQTAQAWCAPPANYVSLRNMMNEIPAVDLMVLPEMFTTGFCTDPDGEPERWCEEQLLPETRHAADEWMRQKATEHDCAVAGSVAVKEGTAWRNRFYLVGPEGEVAHYDKHHLFNYGGEGRHYVPGQARVEALWRGARLRLAVCYDLRFPCWLRQTKGAPYDVLLCVASWPERRRDAWDALLRARAIENQCYVVGVNRVHVDGNALRYSGGSAIIDPLGHTVAAVDDHKEGWAVADIDLDKLAQMRREFPVLDDAD